MLSIHSCWSRQLYRKKNEIFNCEIQLSPIKQTRIGPKNLIFVYFWVNQSDEPKFLEMIRVYHKINLKYFFAKNFYQNSLFSIRFSCSSNCLTLFNFFSRISFFSFSESQLIEGLGAIKIVRPSMLSCMEPVPANNDLYDEI